MSGSVPVSDTPAMAVPVELVTDQPIEVTVPHDGRVMVRVPPLVPRTGDGDTAKRYILVTAGSFNQRFTERGMVKDSHDLTIPLYYLRGEVVRITLWPIERNTF